MFFVALIRLAGSLDDEAKALAEALGLTPYETRLKLVAGLPAVVMTSAEREPATEVLRGLRARGHGAVGFDGSAVVPNESMLAMRNFALEPDAVTVGLPSGERLPYQDISVMLRAAHRTSVESVSVTKETKLSLGRTALTGGLLNTKTVTREQRSTSHDQEQVLYLFRRSGAVPWILRERSTQYTALGKALAPSSMQNFITTIGQLRELARGAVYDERLRTLRGGPTRLALTGVGKTASSTVTSTTADGTDVLAHAIALAVARGVW
ncbi:MAG: hypothetical protein WKG00_32620 [Polyangiaceae bacterium]